VTKIHRAVKFRQEAWMAPYTQLNTDLRAKALSEFERDFFELMNNSVFGKTMENLRKRIWVDLVRGDEVEKMRRLSCRPGQHFA
jgi:DNA-binding transcriptional regulator YbjK